MLLNWTIERARSLRLSARLLRRRARARGERLPVVVVPGMCGSRLRDRGGAMRWGSLGNFYRGPSAADEPGPLRAAGPLEGVPVVPGLWTHDVYGGLLRFLAADGGYARGEDLFVYDYDWRT